MNQTKNPTALALVTNSSLQAWLQKTLPMYDFHWGLALQGAVKIAADLRPAFVLVDLDEADQSWSEVLIALKTNPATRRIPIIGVMENLTTALYKMTKPLDMVAYVNKAAPDQLEKAVAQHARLWDAAYYAAMATACAEDLPDLAREGIRLFDEHEFWEAHEVLEHAWIQEQRPVRDLYRSILQVGVAYYQIQQGNYRGAIKMFLRAVQWLDPLPDECQGIDLAQFKRDAAAARAALEALPPDTINQFDRSLFKPVPFINKP